MSKGIENTQPHGERACLFRDKLRPSLQGRELTMEINMYKYIKQGHTSDVLAGDFVECRAG